jgi:hypothetical protein
MTAGGHHHVDHLCRRPGFAEGWTLLSSWHSAKAVLPGAFLCRVPLDLALGKECLCRVPDKKHPAKHFAPDKSSVSCSESGKAIKP